MHDSSVFPEHDLGPHPAASRARAHFLLIELRTGLTFLDVGETSRRSDTPARTRDRAHEAYTVVSRHLAAADVDFTAEERAEVRRLYAELGARLRLDP